MCCKSGHLSGGEVEREQKGAWFGIEEEALNDREGIGG